ncbi:UNVERIFIED_CONTAM: hypothetical protein HDU68_002491 [Siphonaria sp. JEL0065]|nr:hypothetical protein HDU68_002491 [Siphonaria sp. JEL0065]
MDIEGSSLDVQFNQIELIFEHDPELNVAMYKSFSGNATDIGGVFYHIGKDKFGVVRIGDSKDSWWTWKPSSGRWTPGTLGAQLFCMHELTEYYEYTKKRFQKNTPDAKLAKSRETRLDHIMKVLKNPSLRSGILLEAAAVFLSHDSNFEERLDAILGFANGVYDLSLGEFRAAEPHDYNTMTCGYALPDTIDPQIRKEILTFFNEIQPNTEEREYLQRLLGSSLHGEKEDELFHIFTGETRNGKSVLADIMKYTLNDYYESIKSTMLTGEQGSSSSASPDLMALYRKHFVIGSARKAQNHQQRIHEDDHWKR